VLTIVIDIKAVRNVYPIDRVFILFKNNNEKKYDGEKFVEESRRHRERENVKITEFY